MGEKRQSEVKVESTTTTTYSSLAIQPDAQEKPVSFDDLPTQSHVISSSNKHRAALPNKRRPPARHKPAVTTVDSGVSGQDSGASQDEHNQQQQAQEISTESNTKALDERLLEDYDGDEDTEPHSTIRRGRRSVKRKQPPKGGVSLFGGIDISKGVQALKTTKYSKTCDNNPRESEEESGDVPKDSLVILKQKKEREDKQRQDEETRRRLELEQKRLEEEEAKRREEEKLKQAREQKRADEENQRRKEEELRREENEKKMKQEEEKRLEEEKRRRAEEEQRKTEEKKKKNEEERRRLEEEKRIYEEKKRRAEEERSKAERKKKEEEK